MDPAAVKALCFDVFGTTVDWRTSIVREGRAFGARTGVAADWVRFADRWRELYFPAMARVSGGELPWTRLDALHRMNLDVLLAEFGIGGVGEDDIAEFNRAWHRLDPWPDTVAGMSRLKRRFVVAAVSNGDIEMMVAMAKHGGLPWDVILGAEIARHYKPDPEIYLTAAALIGVAPARCMMVSTHNFDLKAATAVGFRSAYVYRRAAYAPGRTGDLEPVGDYDVVAEDFNDLARRLGC